jgi:hypothetical protein
VTDKATYHNNDGYSSNFPKVNTLDAMPTPTSETKFLKRTNVNHVLTSIQPKIFSLSKWKLAIHKNLVPR